MSKHRVVKVFSGEFAIVEAFYYQLMRLALDVDVKDGNYKDILMETFVSYEVFS